MEWEKRKKARLGQKVSVYVPCFNAEKTLAKCLEAIKAQTYPVDEIIVVDDGSEDRTADVACSFGVSVVCLKRNLGLSAARNRAVREARNEFVAALDADCAAEPDWLEKIMRNFEDPEVVGTCGRLIEKNQSTLADAWRAVYMPQHWGDERIVNPYFLFGADHVYRKGALLELGLFDERYRTNFEDVDMGIRLSQTGKKLIYEPSAIAYHLKTDTPMSAIGAYYRWHSPNYPEPVSWRALFHRWRVYSGDLIDMLKKDLQAGRYSFLIMDILLWLYRSGLDTKRFIFRI